MDMNTDTPPISMNIHGYRRSNIIAEERKDSKEKGRQRRLGGTL
jgi:hypothetical protein